MQGFAEQEDVSFKKLVADYEKASGNTLDYAIIPYAPSRQILSRRGALQRNSIVAGPLTGKMARRSRMARPARCCSFGICPAWPRLIFLIATDRLWTGEYWPIMCRARDRALSRSPRASEGSSTTSLIRTRLSAGGNWIRTPGPALAVNPSATNKEGGRRRDPPQAL